ncbi:ATP-grasp domain-containing protein [Magnetospira thiophila]
MNPLRVMVTGAGSGVGQGIVKALRLSSLPVTVISADIGPLNPGLYRADEALLIPKVEDPSAYDWFRRTLQEQKVDAVLIGSEFDLAFFSRHREELEAATGTKICASPADSVAIADDKLLTTQFLANHALPHARAIAPADATEAKAAAREFGLPVVLKSRCGTSSRHVHVIHGPDDIDRLFDAIPDPMLQEFAGRIGNDLAHEYTCSVFALPDGRFLGPFTARRTLRGGTSWLVEVDHFEKMYPLMFDIAACLPTVGSLNVQMRDGPEGPIPFEFNARFSGTTAVRAHFGFNEPEMYLRAWCLGETLPTPQIRKGMAMRYVEEVFLDDVGVEDLVAPLPKGTVHSWF